MPRHRRVKLDFEKKHRLPEPRRSKKDEFEELTRDPEGEAFEKDPLKDARDILKGPATKGFGGLRRSAEPYEKQKEEASAEEELKPPEYGAEKKQRTRKRYSAKKRD